LIPGGIEHEGWCQEDPETVEIFSPPRADLRLAVTRETLRVEPKFESIQAMLPGRASKVIDQRLQ
jgi:hypothetical protein